MVTFSPFLGPRGMQVFPVSCILKEGHEPCRESVSLQEQIAFALRQHEGGGQVAEIIRKLGVTEQTFYRWKKKFACLGVAELRRLRQLEEENKKLQALVADLSLDKKMLPRRRLGKGLRPDRRKVVVQRLQAADRVSERRMCRALGFPRSSPRYRSVRNGRAELRIRLRDLAASRVRYGYRRLHALLKREGWQVNHKLVYRLYIEEGLQMRIKTPRRRKSCRARVERPKATRANESWSMDFVSDRLFDGRRFRMLTLVDNFTRESLAIRLGQRLTGDDVVAVLEQLQADRGKPQSIRVDNGPEFISKSLDWWAYFNQVTLDFSRPGKPTDNPFIESFNGRLRQECLNQHWFQDLLEAAETVEAWRIDYNEQRPHSSLGDRTPKEFAAWFAQATPERTKPIPSIPTGSRLG